MSRQSPKGFTLIELLVVIAIIGLLSAVVLASLNTARTKSNDGAIKSEVSQLATLYQEQYSDTGSYAPLYSYGSNGWYVTAADCAAPSTPPTGTYATQQEQICAALMRNETTCTTGLACLWLGVPGVGTANNVYSIMAWLPGAQQWFCMGSSGATSLTTNTGWTSTGCYDNP